MGGEIEDLIDMNNLKKEVEDNKRKNEIKEFEKHNLY